MDHLRKKHQVLTDKHEGEISRDLTNQIDWSDRIICIKGFRGVGKSTFLAELVGNIFADDASCLYVDLNSFYFTKRKIYNFADDFYKMGGKVLILDQIQKYPNWAEELVCCYNDFEDLKIVFSSSPALRIWEEDSRLKDIVNIYSLRGLSYREYLNHFLGKSFKPYTLDDIILNHQEIAEEITAEIKPLAYLDQYLVNGYYPYSISLDSNNNSSLLKHINLALEIDITSLNQIELKYLPKLRKLLNILCTEAPFTPNISKLSNEIETSRATVINYLQYLKNAKLINLLYSNGEVNAQKKPGMVYADNTNIQFAVSPENTDTESLRKTFFLNQVSHKNTVNSSDTQDFIVNNKYSFTIGGKYHKPLCENSYAAIGRVDVGVGRTIPLWVFGFLY